MSKSKNGMAPLPPVPRLHAPRALHPPQAHGQPGSGRSTRSPLLPALLLLAATLVTYWPALRGGFIWDDDVMLNIYVKSPGGLRYIWCSTILPDFFPLTSTSLWLEWRLWGMNTMGYHVTNILLHAGSAILLWRILLRLRLPGAWLAAMVFAIHPVNVESVAWITERKNTLAMVFCLASVLWYLRSAERRVSGVKCQVSCAERSDVQGSKFEVQSSRFSGDYALSLLCFLLALLSKTAVVPLPFVLLLCDLWRSRIRNTRASITTGKVTPDTPDTRHPTLASRFTFYLSRFLPLLPFFALSFILGLVTIWFQYHRAIGPDVVQKGGFGSRLAAAGWAVWFYLSKDLLPLNLSFVYPRWEVNPYKLISWLPLLILLIGGLVFLRSRRTWAKGALFGLGCFVLMLLPVLGFVGIYFQRFSLVSDHWQYFAIIAPIALIVCGLSSKFNSDKSRAGVQGSGFRVREEVQGPKSKVQSEGPEDARRGGREEHATRNTQHVSRFTFHTLACLGLILLGLQSRRQCSVYHSEQAMWEDTLKKNPACWLAHNNLGLSIAQKAFALSGQSRKESLGQAMEHYRTSLKIEPDNIEARLNMGSAWIALGGLEDAKAEFEAAQSCNPENGLGYYNLGLLFEQLGKIPQAEAQYRKLVSVWPSYAAGHDRLGAMLEARGKQAEGEAEFAQAVRLQPGMVRALNHLGLSLQIRGKTTEAISLFRQAVEFEPDFAEAHRNLAVTLARQWRWNEAAAEFSEAVRLDPNDPVAHYEWGNLVLTANQMKTGGDTGNLVGDDVRSPSSARAAPKGLLTSSPTAPGPGGSRSPIPPIGTALNQAAGHFEAALKFRPDYPEAHYQLATVLERRGQIGQAIAHFREAIRLRPDWIEALNNLAWVLATSPESALRNGPEAVRLSARAVELTHTNSAGHLDTLATAYAESGEFPRAIEVARKAASMAENSKEAQMANEIRERITLYEAGKPFRAR
ncbi:MAG: hypothetical protein C5B50_17035 [Verrucomicrobia bacterium]|nr:MAG: hypothetical protein C5B50_17035 [Verrucomicrobiota bacterium]